MGRILLLLFLTLFLFKGLVIRLTLKQERKNISFENRIRVNLEIQCISRPDPLQFFSLNLCYSGTSYDGFWKSKIAEGSVGFYYMWNKSSNDYFLLFKLHFWVQAKKEKKWCTKKPDSLFPLMLVHSNKANNLTTSLSVMPSSYFFSAHL